MRNSPFPVRGLSDRDHVKVGERISLGITTLKYALVLYNGTALAAIHWTSLH